MKKLIFVLLLTALGFFWYQVSSVGSAIVPRGQYSVPSGTLFPELNSILGIKVSDWRFRAYKKFYAGDFELKSGTFQVSEDMPLSKALAKDLKTPAYTDLNFMILPGWSVYDIDAFLVQRNFIKPGELISATPAKYPRLVKKYPFLEGKKSFEGFVYPDTHRIRQGADLEEFLFTIIGVFQDRIYSKLTPDQRKNFYSTLILASIVEREERDPEEKAEVAGVLSGRLAIRMNLWADATLCYALQLDSKECKPAKIVEGLDTDNPYNTRKIAGLPPTPISNPSRETWLATLFLKKTEFLYYLHDPDGGIHYAKTNEEHNSNKMKYLK